MSFLASMSFREKTAWAMSAILILAGALYAFEIGGLALALGHTPPPVTKITFTYVAIVVAASIAAMSALGAGSPREANAPPDERERVIGHKAGAWSGLLLGFGVVAAIIHYFPARDGDLLFHLIVAALMISQIAEYIFQIILLRRGV